MRSKYSWAAQKLSVTTKASRLDNRVVSNGRVRTDKLVVKQVKRVCGGDLKWEL
jgi:hypothetical protein